jgi:NADH:ubiquinone oxidoreductase subunit F (NADH-binding)/NADH:ubiquinone oxidoreductase subunit E
MTTLSYDGLFSNLARERASLLPGLHLIEHHAGYIALDGLRALANHIRVPAVEVHAAASTYNELRFAPAPDGVRRICTGLACRLNGADTLLAEAEADGQPFEAVPCFFACGVAPVVEHGQQACMQGRVGKLLELTQVVPSTSETSSPVSPGQRILLVGSGSCGDAVGAAEVASALTEAAGHHGLAIVATGCDGACWAQPVLRLREADGSSRVLAVNSRAEDVDRVLRQIRQPGWNAPDTHQSWLRGQERRVLSHCGLIDPASLADYRASGGYEAWQRARAGLRPEDVRELVRASGLQGRGGAYFAAGIKWQTAITSPGDIYLVVNLEEGEPGVFKDRHLCEGDPHAVVEGTLLAAYALGAPRVYVYINGQADETANRMAAAVAQARAAGLVPDGLFIDFYRGAGGYVCGEESVILNSIEGHRAVPRLRPPFPAESGLWGHPTVVNNAETLANLPLIVRHGAEWFRSVGSDQAPGTKLLCLAGAIERPGLVEAPFGTPLRTIVEGMAGAIPGETVALVMGGPSGGFVPELLLDMPLRPGTLDRGGAILGAGGVTVVDKQLSPLEVARHLTAYNAAESCGKCTPCREGTARTEAILAEALNGSAPDMDGELLDNLNETIRLASLCGLGQAAPNPVTSLLEHFPPTGLRTAKEPSQSGQPATLSKAEAGPDA